MAQYKWNNPLDWLKDHLREISCEEARNDFVDFVNLHADYDTLIEFYQEEMAEDGYWEEL